MLKVGTTDLVLRMIEAGVVMRDLTLENPIRAIREISHDITGRRTVRWPTAAQLSALDLQGEYLRGPSTSSQREGCDDPLHKQVLDLWERTLDRRRDRRPRPGRHRDRLGHQVPAHRAVPRQARPRPRPPAAAPSSTSPTTTSTAAEGLYYLLQRRGLVARVVTDLEIFEAKVASRRRPPAPSCAATSSGPRRSTAATSPSTGCTSSSTTRPSARCCARTRSARRTSGWSGSSRACDAADPASRRGTCRVLPAGDAGVHTGRRYRGWLLSAARQPPDRRFPHVSRRVTTAPVRHRPRRPPSS